MLRRRDDDSHVRADAVTDVDALASRIDTLAAIVRETSGALAATRGELAAAGRRLDERLRNDTARVDDALARARDEIAALLRQPTQGPAGAAAPTEGHDLLARRLETLSGIVGETAGKLAAGEGGLAALRATMTGESTRVEQALAELRQELEALHRRSEPSAGRIGGSVPSESPVVGKILALGDRVEVLSDTVRATAGGLSATNSALTATQEHVGALEHHLGQQVADARELATALVGELASVRGLVTNATVAERTEELTEAVQTLDVRLDAIASLVSTTARQIAIRGDLVEALGQRLGALGERVDTVVLEVRRGRRTLALDVATARTEADLEAKIAPLSEALAQLTGSVEETAAAAERIGTDVREALEQRVETVEHDQRAIRLELVSVEERLDVVSAVAEEARARPVVDPTPVLQELSSRLERIEEHRRETACELAIAEAAWERERFELRRRLDAIAGAALAVPSGEDGDRLVRELAVRLDRLEREHDSVSELSSLADGWTTSLAALAARVDLGLRRTDGSTPMSDTTTEAEELADVAARVATIEADREAVVEQLVV